MLGFGLLNFTVLPNRGDEEIFDDVAFEELFSLRVDFSTLGIAANGTDVWGVGKSTQGIVNGKVGLTCQQHTLPAFRGLIDDLSDDGGLSGARWALNQEHIRRRQGPTDRSFLFFVHGAKRFVLQRWKISWIFGCFVDVKEPVVNVVVRFKFLKTFNAFSLTVNLNQIS